MVGEPNRIVFIPLSAPLQETAKSFVFGFESPLADTDAGLATDRQPWSWIMAALFLRSYW